MGWLRELLAPSTGPNTRTTAEVAALVAPAAEQRTFNSNVIPLNSESFGGYSGAHVSEKTALQHLAVYSCVRLIADSIATLPRDVYRKEGMVRVPLDTPAVISDPDPIYTEFEYGQQVVTSLALRGNAYELVLARDRLDYPTATRVLHPDEVQCTKNLETGMPDYLVLDGGDQSMRPVARENIIHTRRFTLAGHVKGLSPIEHASMDIDLGLAARGYGSRWFKDSANPSAVLSTTENLSEDAALRTMQSWVQSHGGRRHPAILSGGLKYEGISITPEESQFLETRNYSTSEIAMMFGIPPHMIGQTEKSTSWGTGIEQQTLGFVKFSLLSWLRCLETSWTGAKLPSDQFMRFNLEGLQRADLATRFAAYRTAREGGWMNIDEIRALEDQDPLPNGLGQDYLQPLNFAPVGSPAAEGAASGPTPGQQPPTKGAAQ